MTTNPMPPEEPATPWEQARAYSMKGLRIALAGSEVGAIRRIGLYALVLAGLAAGNIAILGMVALVLLIATDDFR